MKIHIVNDKNKIIDGYYTILFDQLQEEFQSISNNSCEIILANDIFDYIEFERIPSIIQELVSKLRLGGTMTVGGKDLHMFCKAVKNNLISEQEASHIVSNSKSLAYCFSVQEIFNQLNLKYTTRFIGINYEITASRG